MRLRDVSANFDWSEPTITQPDLKSRSSTPGQTVMGEESARRGQCYAAGPTSLTTLSQSRVSGTFLLCLKRNVLPRHYFLVLRSLIHPAQWSPLSGFFVDSLSGLWNGTSV